MGTSLSDSVTDESEICVFIPSKRLEKSLKLPTHRPTPTFKDNMKAAILAIVLFGLASAASAQEYDQLEESEARFLYFNSSSTATSLTLLGAVILLGVIGYLVYSGGLLGGASAYNRYDPYAQDQYYQQEAQYQYRSNNDAYGYQGMNIIQWISMLQDIYEKFDYNDLDCQKRLICEVMREPEYFGGMAKKFKNGFQYAKYLEVLSLPDDMRELLDEYLDANSRADQQKECAEFFQCPYSIKDSVKRNFDGNSL